MEEIEKIIETELRKGKSQREIGKIVGICVDYVRQITKQLVEKGRITPEEIEQAKKQKIKTEFLEDTTTQAILKYVKAGLPQDDIARLVGKAQGVISSKIKLLKEDGIISQEEINNAREAYKKELKDDNFTRDAVLENILQGRLIHHFAKELGMTGNGVKFILDSLIAEGKVTKKQIDEAKKRHKEELKKDKQKIKDNEEFEKQVLQMIKKGKSIRDICIKLGITISKVKSIVQKLVKRGDITEKEIKEDIENYEEELERTIIKGLKNGYSQLEIVNMFEEGEVSQQYIQKYIKKLISKGVITEEEIKQYKYESKQGEKELQEFILRGIKQGLSIEEMASEDETGYFTVYRIKSAMKRMQEKGILTNRQIQKTKKEKRKERKKQIDKKMRKIDKELIKLLLKGLKLKEMAVELGYAESTITKKITKLKSEGKITQEQIEEARKNRKQRDNIEKAQKREQEKQEKEEKERQELKTQREQEKEYNLYKKYLRDLQLIYKLESKYTEEDKKELVSKTIKLAIQMQQNGKLETKDLEIIANAIFVLDKVDANNILKIARLYLRCKSYQSAINLLNSSKEFLNEDEECKKIELAVKNIKLMMKNKQAIELLREERCSIEEICRRTSLSLAEIVELKQKLSNKENQESNEIENDLEDEVLI